MVTDWLLVTEGAVKITVDPIVLSSEPPVADQVIVPPATSVDPDFTFAVNAMLLPDSATPSDGDMSRVVPLGSQEGDVT